MSSSVNPPAEAPPPEPAAAAPPPRRRVGPRLALGCAGVVALAAVAALILLAVLRPYARASEELARILATVLPPGSEAEGVRVQFPASVTIERLELPPDPGRGLPALTLHEISGRTVLGSWVRRVPDMSLMTRFWGGSVAFDAVAREKLRPGADGIPPFVVRGEARDLKLEEAIGWLQVDGAWRGRLDLNVAGQVDGGHPRASVMEVGITGRDLHVPEIEFSDVVLPANKRATLRGQATYRDEIIQVDEFVLSGTGYMLEARVRIAVREPLDQSPLRGRVTLQLKEVATWRRTDVDERIARMMMRLLIESKGKLHARLSGTVGEPKAELDEQTLIQSLLGPEG